MKKRDDDANLSCSFCGKSQREVKKLIAGRRSTSATSASSSATTSSPRSTARKRAAAPDLAGSQAAGDQGRSLDEYVIGQEQRQEDPGGGGAQPLPAHREPDLRGRRGAAEGQHPAAGPHRLGQDAARADPGAHPRRAVHDRRRHHAHRGGLRRRGRREHHPEPAAGRELRRRARAARHHLHRRDRQDRPQEREPLDHPRRLGRGRAAGAAQDHRGHDGERAAQGRTQAPAAGVPADRHLEHPVHLRRRLLRSRVRSSSAASA